MESRRARSSNPLAWSVARVTVPGDVETTFARLTEFDNATINFNHDPTWAALPVALRGVFDPDSNALMPASANARISKCVRALCRYGRKNPTDTVKFVDVKDSGLRPIRTIEWAPTFYVRVKGVCWYMGGDVPTIPLLQPRKIGLTLEQMRFYVRLGHQAFCNGDWAHAKIVIHDLSGDDLEVSTVLHQDTIGMASDEEVKLFMTTFLAAKARADKVRAERPATSTKPEAGLWLFD